MKKCEVCGKEMDYQPAAMAFRNGDPSDPYYYCYDCSPDPFAKSATPKEGD